MIYYQNKFQAYSNGDSPYATTFYVTAPTVSTSGPSSLKSLRINTGTFSTTYFDNIQFSNGTITARCKSTSFMGIAFRIGQQNNAGFPNLGYILQIQPNVSNQFILYRMSGGGSSIGTTTGTCNTNDFTMKIIAQGSSIKCYLDGTLLLDVTDSTYTNGYFGITSQSDAYATNITLENTQPQVISWG